MCSDRAKEAYELEAHVLDRLDCGPVNSKMAMGMTRRVCAALKVTGPELYFVHPQVFYRGYCWHATVPYRGELVKGVIGLNALTAGRGTVVHEIGHWVTGKAHGHCEHWAQNVVRAARILWPNRYYWRWFEGAYAPLLKNGAEA